MSVLVQTEEAAVKAPGSAASSPAAAGASGASPATADASATSPATDAAADPPISEVDLQAAWRLLDWSVGLFLCASLLHFACLRAVIPGMCAVAAIGVAIWYGVQRARGDSKVLETAMGKCMGGAFLIVFISFYGQIFWSIIA